MIPHRLERVIGRVLGIGRIGIRVDQGEFDDPAVDARHLAVLVAVHPRHAAVQWSADSRRAALGRAVAVDEDGLAGAAVVDELAVSDALQAAVNCLARVRDVVRGRTAAPGLCETRLGLEA